MMAPSILPPNSTATERAFEAAMVNTRRAVPPAETIMDPQRCPAQLLPYLAWALSVEEWDAEAPESVKRETLQSTIEIHRHKGTPWSLRRVLKAAGYGDAIVQEFNGREYDGTEVYDGASNYSNTDHWAEYRVILARPITNTQATKVRALLRATAPVRCVLKLLDYAEVQWAYEGSITYDGTYNYGDA